jgi:hypothetical protein
MGTGTPTQRCGAEAVVELWTTGHGNEGYSAFSQREQASLRLEHFEVIRALGCASAVQRTQEVPCGQQLPSGGARAHPFRRLAAKYLYCRFTMWRA